MPANKSSTADKQKASPRQNAARKVAGRDDAPQDVRLPASQKQADQRRFPGETPLTGEDRPVDRAGGKQRGRSIDLGTAPDNRDKPFIKAPAQKRRPGSGPR